MMNLRGVHKLKDLIYSFELLWNIQLDYGFRTYYELDLVIGLQCDMN